MCRACAVLPAAEAQLAQGQKAGLASAVAGLVFGALLVVGTLWWGIPMFAGSSRYEGRFIGRLVGLGLGLGLVALIVSWRNFQIYRRAKR